MLVYRQYTSELKNKSSFNDLPYNNAGDYGTKNDTNSVHDSGLSTIYGLKHLKQILPGGSSILRNLVSNGVFRRPPFGLKARYSINRRDDNQPIIIGQVEVDGEVLNRYFSPTYGIYLGSQPLPEPAGSTQSQPPTISVDMPQSPNTNVQPPSNPPVVQNPAQRMTFNLSIILIILFAVLKFGLVNLKTISFLKLLFLFLFKLKFALKLLTFKFLILLNLLFFFKVWMIPLYNLLLWPIFNQ